MKRDVEYKRADTRDTSELIDRQNVKGKKAIYLFVSLFVNITLLSLLVYLGIHRQNVTVVVESEGVNTSEVGVSTGYFSNYLASSCIVDYIQSKALLSDEELIDLFMATTEEISCGITNKDILASLLLKKGITIDVPLKARGKWPQEMVAVPYTLNEAGKEKKECLECFTSLSSEDALGIKQYLLVEKMPYTTQKIFSLLQDPMQCTPSVIDTFIRSQEWIELEKALFPLFKDDTKLLLYIKLFSWNGVIDHINLIRKRSEIPGSSEVVVASDPVKVKPLTLQDLSLIVARDFARTRSPHLAQIFISMCPPQEIKKSASSDFISLLFEALPRQASQESIALAVEIAKGPSKDILFEKAKGYISSSINAPQICQMSRSQFVQKFSPLAVINHKAFEESLTHICRESLKPIAESGAGTQKRGSQGSSDKGCQPVAAVSKPDAIKADKIIAENSKGQSSSSGKPSAKKPVACSQSAKKIQSPKANESSSYASKIASQQAKEAISPYILYTVRKGDTLWALSKRFGVSVDKIRYLNKIKGNTLPPGIVIKIPKAHTT